MFDRVYKHIHTSILVQFPQDLQPVWRGPPFISYNLGAFLMIRRATIHSVPHACPQKNLKYEKQKLRYNSHAIHFILLKCTIQEFLMHS